MKLGLHKSHATEVEVGVPRGPVLGHLLFAVYIAVRSPTSSLTTVYSITNRPTPTTRSSISPPLVTSLFWPNQIGAYSNVSNHDIKLSLIYFLAAFWDNKFNNNIFFSEFLTETNTSPTKWCSALLLAHKTDDYGFSLFSAWMNSSSNSWICLTRSTSQHMKKPTNCQCLSLNKTAHHHKKHCTTYHETLCSAIAHKSRSNSNVALSIQCCISLWCNQMTLFMMIKPQK